MLTTVYYPVRDAHGSLWLTDSVASRDLMLDVGCGRGPFHPDAGRHLADGPKVTTLIQLTTLIAIVFFASWWLDLAVPDPLAHPMGGVTLMSGLHYLPAGTSVSPPVKPSPDFFMNDGPAVRCAHWRGSFVQPPRRTVSTGSASLARSSGGLRSRTPATTCMKNPGSRAVALLGCVFRPVPAGSFSCICLTVFRSSYRLRSFFRRIPTCPAWRSKRVKTALASTYHHVGRTRQGVVKKGNSPPKRDEAVDQFASSRLWSPAWKKKSGGGKFKLNIGERTLTDGPRRSPANSAR